MDLVFHGRSISARKVTAGVRRTFQNRSSWLSSGLRRGTECRPGAGPARLHAAELCRDLENFDHELFQPTVGSEG